MIRFFPYYRMTVETNMPLDKIVTRFQESTGREKFRWPWQPLPETAFLGEVTDRGFRVHNSLRDKRSFPEARGKFIEEPSGTTVDVRIMFHPNTYISMAVPLLILLLSLAALLLHAKPIGIFTALALLSSLGLVFTYITYTILFNIEFENTAELIRQVASDRGLDATFRESLGGRTKRNGRIFATIMAIWVLAFCAFAVYDSVANGPKAETHLKVVQAEFKAIPTPPKTRQLDYDASSKPRIALVDASFDTDLTYQQVKHFYDTELPRHGWHFVKEEKLRDWGEDLGGMTVDYRKGDYTASLQWAGKDPDCGWDYALDLSWGLDD